MIENLIEMERFAKITSSELDQHIESITPENTIKKMNWAKKIFREKYAQMKLQKFLNQWTR